ncbi:hypothetical protein TYRP_008764 [Tyrophagus putrescentiae]|nr:hypothetical protein TYRP_008764 [Tyrophagus putrescentiae]
MPTFQSETVVVTFFLFFLLSICLRNGVGEQAEEDACKRIVSDKVFATDPILCIGQLKASILVVTRALKIWQVAGRSLDQSIGKLYFGKKPPVPIEQKWPPIAADPTFQAIHAQGIPSCNTARLEQFYTAGLAWDINGQRAVPGNAGMQNVHQDDQVRWISSLSMDHYYCITYQGGLVMVRYQFCKCATSGEAKNCSQMVPCDRISECHGAGPVGPGGACLDPLHPPFRRVCQKGDKSLYIEKSGEHSEGCTPITWKVYNGFVDNGTVYLFAEDSVWSFPQSAYDSPAPVTYHGQKWSSFIECDSSPGGRGGGAGKSGVTMGVIVAAILLLVLLCLCGLLCLYRDAVARRQKKSKGGKGGKGDTGALLPLIGVGGGNPGKSARSAGPLGFGLISAKKPSSSKKGASKRSHGGLVSAGDISKKKGAAAGSSKKTKRSVAVKTGAKSISRKGGGAGATSTKSPSTGGRPQATQRSAKISQKAKSKSTKSKSKSKSAKAAGRSKSSKKGQSGKK